MTSYTIETMHEDCPACDVRALDAEVIARCTGSVAGTSKLVEGDFISHAALARKVAV